MPSSLYGEGRRELGIGDLLALYTDGVVETPNAHGEEFGNARLVEILQRHAEVALPELLTRVIDAVDRWSGGGLPHDDVTLVLARTR
jgi:sigma-B regulation protein RsbU (phosphoserine phosphatase)